MPSNSTIIISKKRGGVGAVKASSYYIFPCAFSVVDAGTAICVKREPCAIDRRIYKIIDRYFQ